MLPEGRGLLVEGVMQGARTASAACSADTISGSGTVRRWVPDGGESGVYLALTKRCAGWRRSGCAGAVPYRAGGSGAALRWSRVVELGVQGVRQLVELPPLVVDLV